MGYDLDALQRVYEEVGAREYDPNKYVEKNWRSNSWKYRNSRQSNKRQALPSSSSQSFPEASEIVE